LKQKYFGIGYTLHATALLVAGSTLTLWIPGQTLLNPTARTQAFFKGCLYVMVVAAYVSFQLMYSSSQDIHTSSQYMLRIRIHWPLH